MNLPSTCKAIILFDGVCNLCNAGVDFIIRRDSQGIFCFASLQSDIGKQWLSHCKATGEAVVLVVEGQCFTGSDAVLEVLRRLGPPWRWLYVFRYIPGNLREALYRWIASHRYRWFGKRDTCRIPSHEERKRFLDYQRD